MTSNLHIDLTTQCMYVCTMMWQQRYKHTHTLRTLHVHYVLHAYTHMHYVYVHMHTNTQQSINTREH